MNRSRRIRALVICGVGAVAALLSAPLAAAEGCENAGGGGDGGFTSCVSPGNAEIVATPNDLGVEGAEADQMGDAPVVFGSSNGGVFGGF